MARGKFIVFEGADYTGKTTLAKMTSDWLASMEVESILTKHPGSTGVGGELRHISKHSKEKIPPITEALINAAANSAFIEEVLIPHLENGIWVLGDRNNFVSSMVYQLMSGVTLTSLDKVHDATHPHPPKIDALFILRASEPERQKRREKRGDSKFDRYEQRKDYVEGVAAAYEILAEEHEERLRRFVKTTPNSAGGSTPMAFYIDADPTPEEMFDVVRESLKAILPQRLRVQAQRR